MTDPSSILTALQSIRAASDVVKALRAADVSYEKAELKLRVAELAELLADARMSVLDAQEEIQILQKKLQEADRRRSLKFQKDAYWEVVDGANVDGPFCPKCLDADGKEIRMIDRGNGYTCCVQCGHCTDTPGYVQPPDFRNPYGDGF